MVDYHRIYDYNFIMTDKIVIIDNGSAYTKAGFADEEFPKSTIPTIVGKPKYQNEFLDDPYDSKVVQTNAKKHQKFKKLGIQTVKQMIGEKVLSSPSIYNVNFPIKKGVIVNLDELLDIYNYIYFNDLKVDPSNTTLLMTESLSTTNKNRGELLEVAFEALRVPMFGLVPQVNLPLKSKGLSTGLVVDIGHGCCQIAPIVDDYLIAKATIFSDFFTGGNLSQVIQNFISRSKLYEVDGRRDFKLMENIKQKLCEFAPPKSFDQFAGNYNKSKIQKETFTALYDTNQQSGKIFEFPDGSVADLGAICNITTDMFFNPYLLGHEGENFPSLIYNALSNCEIDNRKAVASGIMLTGGSSKIQKFSSILDNYLKNMPTDNRLNASILNVDKNAHLSVWTGASILCAIDDHLRSKFWVSKQDYEEQGLRLISHFKY